MPYNTQPIKRDQQNSPIPQYFNSVTDVYEALLGRNGAPRAELVGPDGNPISTTAGKLDVRASELETILNTLGTEATLAAILSALAAPISTQLTGSNIPLQRTIYLDGEITKLTTPTYDGSGQGVHPSVVFIPKGFHGYKYWMAFTPYPAGNNDYENPSILASNDCETWVVPEGLTNPVVVALVAPAYNYDPELVYDGTNLVLYWGNSTGAYQKKTSSDGVTWSEATTLTFTVASSIGAWSAPGIIKESATKWKAWGCSTGAPAVAHPGSLTYYESADGDTWVFNKIVPTNLTFTPWHLSVYRDGAGYHFLVCAHNPSLNANVCSLYYGFSEDGNYVTFQAEPVIMPGLTNWANNEIYRSCFVPGDAQTLNIILSACDVNTVWHIGKVAARLNNPYLLASQAINPRPRVVKRWLWQNLEIRDTNVVESSKIIMDMEIYANKALLIRSSHDQIVNLSIVSRIRSTDIIFYGSPATATNEQRIGIPASATYTPFMLTSAHLGALAYPLPLANLYLKAKTIAPTAGSLDIMLICWE